MVMFLIKKNKKYYLCTDFQKTNFNKVNNRKDYEKDSLRNCCSRNEHQCKCV